MSSHHHHDDDDASEGYYAPLNDSARLPPSRHTHRHSGQYTDEEAGLLERALASNDSLATHEFQYGDDNDQAGSSRGSRGRDDGSNDGEASYTASVLLNKISAAMESEEGRRRSSSHSHGAAQSSTYQSSHHQAQQHQHNLQTAVQVGALTAAVTSDDCSEIQSTADVGSIGGIESAVSVSRYDRRYRL